MRPPILTVTQLNNYVKSLLEGDSHLSSVYLKGEISNFKNHFQSGHLYLSLKDGGAVIKAVMFRFAAAQLKFRPEDGMCVICRGRVSLYERDGSYQFYIDEMIPDGVGELSIAFEQIKERLSKQGYFDESHKKAIPKFPRNIGVITSETGAAVQDILNVLSRRYPLCNVILCPVHVQGEHTVPDLLDAISRIQKFNDVDVLIIGRGGGSIEDLWAFNNEELAYAIFECKIPVISAVGHETDFTICDFVSDLRAPTPSAAAELAVPDINELVLTCDSLYDRLLLAQKSRISNLQLKLTGYSCESMLLRQNELIEKKNRELSLLSSSLCLFYSLKTERQTSNFKSAVEKLSALSPLNTLSRGYSYATKDGRAIKNSNQLKVDEKITVKFSSGSAECKVLSVKKGE